MLSSYVDRRDYKIKKSSCKMWRDFEENGRLSRTVSNVEEYSSCPGVAAANMG